MKKTFDLEEYRDVRNEVKENLEKYLVGPFKEDEILGEKKRPMNLYLSGKLVPFGSSAKVVNEEELGIQTNQLLEDEKVDEYIMNRDIFRPSTMGFSFKLKELCSIHISARWGMYKGNNHARIQHQEDWKVRLKPNETNVLENKKMDSDPARVKYTVIERDGLYHISVFLLNSYERKDTFPKQDEIMFQTKLIVNVPKHNIVLFSSKADRFNIQNELLYRDFYELAVGHGVGVDWYTKNDMVTIESKWLPFYELPSIEHRKIEGHSFSMKELSKQSAQELYKTLSIIPNEYRKWLKQQEEVVQTLETSLKDAAEQNIQKVKKIISRVEEGIEIITKSDKCIEKQAFQFANRCMMLQRAQTKVALEYRSSGKRIKPVYDGEWRLFQIIFLLMNIPSITNPKHDDRKLVDLIWFPTGGGKTEAYLGVAAFTMAFRRLKVDILNPEEYAGVTIFMRYTLRLLTTQQFQRAAALICAAEYIRKEEPIKYGEIPFSIGLWIGNDSSPNTYEDAEKKIKEIREGKEIQKGNPMQLLHCPWCGTELTPDDYIITEKSQKIFCHNPQCEFYSGQGLPVYTIDEAIYDQVPTILIGTVDKIAQIAWKSNMYELFGLKNFYHPDKGFIFEDKQRKRGWKKINRLLPPELIIQDELHLISGPLGSLTGLYEVAVDLLCTRNDGIGPKIIASTATISGAEKQIKSLFGRDVCQFPFAVQKSDDNFVSYTISTKEKPGRLYMGICSPGVSGKIQAIQTYAALFTITRTLQNKHIDPYWTIVGYFNTVKELSGMLTSFKDEVSTRLDVLDPDKKFSHELYVEELTSRKKAKEIPEILNQMEKTKEEPGVLDVVLATNMISVGVDIDRLGLMIVQGQPKTTSEYIQATSRIGRKFPGLVLTIFNPLRSRDLSHYERFKAYHQTYYRNVEATSVTPFSIGSRRKGLTGAFIGFLRQSLPEISNEHGANKFEKNSTVLNLKDLFLERIMKTEKWNKLEANQDLIDYIDWWDQTAKKYSDKLSYRKSQYVSNHLMRQFTEHGKTPESKPAMNTLRNVEGEITVEEMRVKDEQ